MTTIETLSGTLTPVTQPAPAGRPLRSVAAVLGGLLSTFAVTTAVDMALHTSGVFPPLGERMADSLFVLAFAYRIPFNVLGSYLAARLAPSRPMLHALALGVVGFALATVGANIAIALPCAWAGGRVRVERV
jgi:hypothetical protein